MLIILLCYAAVLKKSTYYACINAQFLPSMFIIVLHLLLLCFRIRHCGQKMNGWSIIYITTFHRIIFNKTASRMTVLYIRVQ